MDSKKFLLIGFAAAVIILIVTFFSFSNREADNQAISDASGDLQEADFSRVNGALPAWMSIELIDINSGENFKVSDFDKPVLLESFAVWCPTCKRQQEEIKKFHEEVGESVISISLDTDASEDEARVLEHAEKNGFNWRYAVSPIEMTQSLVDEFGTRILSAPSVPVVLICADGSYRVLDSGVKKVIELKEAVASCPA